MKSLKLLVALIALVSFFAFGVVAGSENYDIADVDVNGIDVDDAEKIVFVERGETISVVLDILGIGTVGVEDVKVKASLEGLDDEDIETRTDAFDIEPEVTYSKRLKLNLPYDIESGDYNLVVRVYDKEYSEEFSTTVRVEGHALNIIDVILRPEQVDAGNTVFVVPRVKNVGDSSEDDIKVRATIPELGLSARSYLDDLVTEEDEDDDNKDSASLNDLYLRIPKNAKSGTYDVVVTVEYNKGRDKETITVPLTVVGKEEATVEALVNIDRLTQTVAQGEAVVYKVSFVNLGDSTKTFSLEVSGANWATTRVDPGFVTLAPNTAGDLYVYVSAQEDAALGKHAFAMRVKSGATVLKELSVEADVKGAVVGTDGVDWKAVKKGVEIGLAVLIALLVILGIVVLFGKLRRNSPEEPEVAEGQSYYNYPRY